ncbi:MAG: ABC transporter ATP-binding protein [Desulfurococcales archaeon]|nr:ABC transporter ATP-binding protein [Desulfurococcales archaeon]
MKPPGVVLSVRGVTKRFRGHKALDSATMSVPEGSITGLLGPNGAGKTTLIRVALGLLRRDSGSVELYGRDPLRDPEARRHVGVVFERPVLPDAVPVKTLLEHAARIYGRDEARDVAWAIKASGLSGYEHKRFSELSAGYKQRAAIAHALVARPGLLIADEPTSNLDPVERVKILNLLVELNESEGMTVMVSSHILAELLRVARNVVVMSRGRVVAQGPPEDVMGGFKAARIRAREPEALKAFLESRGFKCSVSGLSVIARIDGGAGASSLLRVLSEAVGEGFRVYSVDLVEPGLEEVLVDES